MGGVPGIKMPVGNFCDLLHKLSVSPLPLATFSSAENAIHNDRQARPCEDNVRPDMVANARGRA